MTRRSFPTIERQVFREGMLVDAAALTREQDYHRRHREVLTQAILEPGVLGGFDVALSGAHLLVGPGGAIDALGRLVILSTRAVDADQKPLKFNAEMAELKLPAIPSGGSASLSIAFGETAADPESGQADASPVLAVTEPGQPVPAPAILLATIRNTATGASAPQLEVEISHQRSCGLAIKGQIAASRIAGLDTVTATLARLTKAVTPLEKMPGALADLSAQADERHTQFASLEHSVEQIGEAVDALMPLPEEVRDMRERLGTMGATLDFLEPVPDQLAELSDTSGKQDGRLSTIDHTLERVTAKLGTLDGLPEKLADVTRQIDGMGEFLNRISDFPRMMTHLMNTTDAHTGELRALEKSASHCNSKLADLTPLPDKLKDVAAQAQANASGLQSAHDRLAALDGVEQSVHDQSERLQAVQAQSSAHDTQLAGLKEAPSKISYLMQSEDRLSQRLHAAEQALGRLEQIEASLTAINGRLDAIEKTATRIDDIETHVNSIEKALGKVAQPPGTVEPTDEPRHLPHTLKEFRAAYPHNDEKAMVAAYRDGNYNIGQISAFFGHDYMDLVRGIRRDNYWQWQAELAAKKAAEND
ncbi:hypothetical protein GN330_13660 [Nitratireductor sp. CAU 1489]|uniref:Uncharacterized protein n=1 Tax=Nitratireductor arenosus TaxID=2682096 RepID=A0A844QG10_9HYPH|nr:hypothetical protein [Nitratireductor arenosus]MVA98292.1 hypothetical protein [Nitratireductor arenosus]